MARTIYFPDGSHDVLFFNEYDDNGTDKKAEAWSVSCGSVWAATRLSSFLKLCGSTRMLLSSWRVS